MNNFKTSYKEKKSFELGRNPLQFSTKQSETTPASPIS